MSLSPASSRTTAQPLGPFPNVALPAHPRFFVTATSLAANQAIACRVIIPASGTITDFGVVITTQSGNLDAAIYSTASPRVRLWSSGSTACPAAGAWRSMGNPSLAVTIGDQYDLAIAADNGVAAFAGLAFLGGNTMEWLLAGWMPVAGGASPYLAWTANASFPCPATVSEAALAPPSTLIAVGVKIA